MINSRGKIKQGHSYRVSSNSTINREGVLQNVHDGVNIRENVMDLNAKRRQSRQGQTENSASKTGGGGATMQTAGDEEKLLA